MFQFSFELKVFSTPFSLWGRRIGESPHRVLHSCVGDLVLSYKGRTVDALGQRADEGRGKRRYAGGSCNRAMIPGFPNGVTRHELNLLALPPEHIGWVEGSRGTETSKYPDE